MLLCQPSLIGGQRKRISQTSPDGRNATKILGLCEEVGLKTSKFLEAELSLVVERESSQ